MGHSLPETLQCCPVGCRGSCEPHAKDLDRHSRPPGRHWGEKHQVGRVVVPDLVLTEWVFLDGVEELRCSRGAAGRRVSAPACVPVDRISRFKSTREWQCPPGRDSWVGTEVPFGWKGLSLKDTGSLIGGFRDSREDVGGRANKGRSTRERTEHIGSLERMRKLHKDVKNSILSVHLGPMGGWERRGGRIRLGEPHLFVPRPLQSPLVPSFCAQDKATTSKACFVIATEPCPHHVTLRSVQDQQGFVKTPLC